MHGHRAERGERGFAAIELLQLDAMSFLQGNAEIRIEGADAIDLVQVPSILLESLGLGLAAGENALDGINELLFGLVLLVELQVVG